MLRECHPVPRSVHTTEGMDTTGCKKGRLLQKGMYYVLIVDSSAAMGRDGPEVANQSFVLYWIVTFTHSVGVK